MAIGSVAAIILALGFIFYHLSGLMGGAGKESKLRDLIDAELKDSAGNPLAFPDFGVLEGESFPYLNPKTGKRTLYPAEKCFWTKDGKAKLTPTYVLLNQHIQVDGETKCPDCGRPVRPHNPAPPPDLMSAAALEGRN